MAKATHIKAFSGLHTTQSALRLPMGALLQATNLDVTDTGALQARAGWRRRLEQSALRSIFASQDESRLYAVAADSLYSIDAHGDPRLLLNGLPLTGRVLWSAFNSQVLWSMGDAAGLIQPDDTVLPLRCPAPAVPVVTLGTGHLPAGQYGVVLTEVLPDGRETCACEPQWLPVPEGACLQISGLPVDAQVAVYVCPADSTVFGLAGFAQGGVFAWDAPANALGPEPATLQRVPLPDDLQAMCLWRGRLAVGASMPGQDQSAIYLSDALAPHLFDLVSGFFLVTGEVRLLAAHPGALVIGTDRQVLAYDGESLSVLANWGVPYGDARALDGGRLLLWTDRGLCQFPEFTSLTNGRASVPAGQEASACLVEANGQKRLLVTYREGDAPAHNPRTNPFDFDMEE